MYSARSLFIDRLATALTSSDVRPLCVDVEVRVDGLIRMVGLLTAVVEVTVHDDYGTLSD